MLKESASLNVNADNGQELTGILGDIMRLAGMKEVSTDMFNQSEPLPMVKALHIVGAGEPSSHEENLMGDTCPTCGETECGCEAEMEETYDNTPEPKTQKYDPNSMANVINKVKSSEMSTTPYGSGSNPMPEVKESYQENDPVTASLWQAYNDIKAR